jgi:hypothetical protein
MEDQVDTLERGALVWKATIETTQSIHGHQISPPNPEDKSSAWNILMPPLI